MLAFPGACPRPVTSTRSPAACLPCRTGITHSSAWVNTAALTIAGVDASTPDPADGRIERDESGQPTRTLHDGAMRLVADRLPRPSTAELLAGLLAGQTHLHSLGITSFQDACVGAAGELGMPDSFDTYRMAADYGMLSCQVVGALVVGPGPRPRPDRRLPARREQASDGQFRATTVKLMLDGVCGDVHRRDVRPVPGPGGASHRPQRPPVHRAGGAAGSRGPAWARRDSSCTFTPSAITRSAPRST